jgi:hypothetical protein
LKGPKSELSNASADVHEPVKPEPEDVFSSGEMAIARGVSYHRGFRDGVGEALLAVSLGVLVGMIVARAIKT